ncbi:MAG: ABC transporter ATP-binding protein [Candidatus Aegiribacteria sp.]
MVRMKDLSFSYGGKEILRNLDMEFRPGETVMITGPNGAGKSTILRLLAGVLIPTSGTVDHGFPEGTDPRRKTAFLPDSLSIYRSMTPLEAAKFHGGIFGTEPSGLEIARSAGVDLNKKISELSVGQRVLVQLSIILSTDPEIILIDEVLHAVDPYLRGLLFRELIRVMEEQNPAVVMVNLNFTEIENLVDRVVFLGSGGIRLDEGVDDLKAGTRRVISEEVPEGLPVILSSSVLGKRHHIVYPFGGDGKDHPGLNISGMDLTDIMTAFMGAEYDAG